MPRIRTIKPEFFSDEKMSLLDPITRFVFLGLICMADDAGRLVDNVKLIDGMLFPSTDDTCRESLEKLAKLGRIIRYESASNQQLIQVANWKRHQKVDHPNKYVLPGPRAGAGNASSSQPAAIPQATADLATPSGEPRENLAQSSRYDLRPTTNDQLPTTNDLRPKKRSSGRRDSLPAAAREFGKVFYRDRGASRERQEDVHRQLVATLNGGARLKRGVKVPAGSVARLEAKCREVIAEGVKDPDKAIVVLLTKLSDVSDDSPTERAAAELKQTERRDEVDTKQRLADAFAWLAEHTDVAAAIDQELDATLDAQTPKPEGKMREMTRRMMHRSAVLKRWTDAGEPAPAAGVSA